MSALLRLMAAAFVVALVGLGMVFYSLERLSLIDLAATLGQSDPDTPATIVVSLFAGLALANLGLFWAIRVWSGYLAEHPRTSQAPVWLMVPIAAIGATGFVVALAIHASYLRGLDEVPADVSWGYIAFQLTAALLVTVPMVLLAARWAPGLSRRRRLA